MLNDRFQKLIGLFAVFLLLFNFPMIGIFSGNINILGIPSSYFYIFAIWLLMIIALWQLAEREKGKSKF